MAAKLKSILKQIHWSLFLRGAIFALAWFFLPFWLFFLIALYLYFVPPFQARRLFWPFLSLLILTFIEPANPIFILIFGGIFYYLLLIKDLLLIDRRSAFEILIFVLSFLLLRNFYHAFGGGLSGGGIWYSLLISILIGILASRFMSFFAPVDVISEQEHPLRRIAGWLAFLLSWQFIILGIFLPVNFAYQTVIIFLALALIIDLTTGEYLKGVSSSKVLITGLTIFAVLVLILASANWAL